MKIMPTQQIPWDDVFRTWLLERPALDRIEYAVVPRTPSEYRNFAYTGPVHFVKRAE